MDTDLAIRQVRAGYAAGVIDLPDLIGRLDAAIGGHAKKAAKGLPAAPLRGARPRSWQPDMALLQRLAEIEDPRNRCAEAAAVADAAKDEQEAARQLRMRAMVIAHVRYGFSQVRIFTPFGPASRYFRAELRQASSNLEKFGPPELNDRADELARQVRDLEEERAKPAKLRPVREELKQVREQLGEAAMAQAHRWHDAHEAARWFAETARLVRDREIRDLTDGKYGKRVKNADLARQLDYSTARIAQIRNSPVAEAA